MCRCMLRVWARVHDDSPRSRLLSHPHPPLPPLLPPLPTSPEVQRSECKSGEEAGARIMGEKTQQTARPRQGASPLTVVVRAGLCAHHAAQGG